MRAGQEFIARDEAVVIRATPRGEGYRILDSAQEDGSRIKDPERAWGEIETTLRRQLGASDEQVAAIRAIHDAAAEGELVELAPGLAIKKGRVEDFSLQVRLFGQHAWKVAFSRISCRPELLPARSYHL